MSDQKEGVKVITSHSRGHKIIFLHNKWLYSDSLTPLDAEERPCKRCGRMPTIKGYDACIGEIKGAKSACCGHGVEEQYIIY